MTTEAAPGYEVFLRPGGGRGALKSQLTEFLEALTPGIPVLLPEAYRDKKVEYVSGYGSAIGKKMGYTIRMRTINGEVWACRLRTEDDPRVNKQA